MAGVAIAACAVLWAAAAAGATPTAFSPVFPIGPVASPALAASPDGTAWLAGGAPSGAVRLWIRRPGGELLGPRRFAARPGFGAYDIRVAAGSGWAVVAWATDRHPGGGEQRLEAVRCTTGGCGPVRTVSFGRVFELRAAAVGARALLLWAGQSHRRSVFSQPVNWTLSDTHGRYGATRNVGDSSNSPTSSLTALVATSNGHAVAAWVRDVRGPGQSFTERVATAEFSGRSFGRPRDAPGPDGADPQLAAAGREVLLAWRGGDGDTDMSQGTGPVYAASRGAGHTSFAPAQEVVDCSCDQVTLAASPTGRALVSYESYAQADAVGSPSGPATPMTSLREPGGAFSAVSIPGGAIAVDATGTATVAWIAGGGTTLYAAQAPPLQLFGAPVVVTATALVTPTEPPGLPPILHLSPRGISFPQAHSLGNGTLLVWQLPATAFGPRAPPGFYQGAVGP